ANQTFTGTVTAGGFVGSGAGLTNLPVSSVGPTTNSLIVGWGDNGAGQATAPAGVSNVVAVGAGGLHGLAVKNDGTVVAWGQNLYGGATVPAGLSNVTAVAAGFYHSLALKNDGTVVAWGYNGSGATNVPPGLNNVAAVAAGRYHSLALKNDGTVVAWGSSYSTVPAGLTNIIAIGPGCAANHVLAIQRQHIISPATLVDG